MGSITLLQLEQNVLNLLNETFDSTAADLRAGAAGGATIPGITPSSSSAASTVKTLLNEAAAELARSCYPVPDVGTLSWSSGLRSQLIASFTPGTTGNVLWAIRGAKWLAVSYTDIAINGSNANQVTSSGNPFESAQVGSYLEITGGSGFNPGTYTITAVSSNVATLSANCGTTASTGGTGSLSAGALKYSERAAVERYDPNWMTTSGAAPSYWYLDGEMSIGVYPAPYTTGLVEVNGFVVPALLNAYSDTMTWLPDDLSHLLVWYAADMVARKNMEDQALSARSDDWREWRFLYDTARQDLWSKIPASMRPLYPTPPITSRPVPMGAPMPSMMGVGDQGG